MVDSEGKTYAGTNAVQDSSREAYIQPLLDGQKRLVIRYDDMGMLEMTRENLVYGVRCDPFQVNGVEFIGIVGFAKINMIEERLKIDSFDGRGYTGIIDAAGNYVVNRDRSAGIGKKDNYFKKLQERTTLSENRIADITARLHHGEAFIKHFGYVETAGWEDRTQSKAIFHPPPAFDD